MAELKKNYDTELAGFELMLDEMVVEVQQCEKESTSAASIAATAREMASKRLR